MTSVRWTLKEGKQLLDERKRKISNEEIATLHNRSVGACLIRARMMAVKQCKTRYIKSVAEEFNLSEDDITEQVDIETKKLAKTARVSNQNPDLISGILATVEQLQAQVLQLRADHAKA